MDEVREEWRKLHNEELNDLYSSPNITEVRTRRDEVTTSSLLVPNILLSALFSNIRSSLIGSGRVSHPYKTKSNIITLYIF